MNLFNRHLRGVKIIGGGDSAVAKLLAAWDAYDEADRAAHQHPRTEAKQRNYEAALDRMCLARSRFVLEGK